MEKSKSDKGIKQKQDWSNLQPTQQKTKQVHTVHIQK